MSAKFAAHGIVCTQGFGPLRYSYIIHRCWPATGRASAARTGDPRDRKHLVRATTGLVQRSVGAARPNQQPRSHYARTGSHRRWHRSPCKQSCFVLQSGHAADPVPRFARPRRRDALCAPMAGWGWHGAAVSKPFCWSPAGAPWPFETWFAYGGRRVLEP